MTPNEERKAMRAIDVMAMVAQYVDYLMAGERMTGTAEQAEQYIEGALTMRYHLHHLAWRMADTGDTEGADFINWALSAEGLAELKRMHQQQPPALPMPVSVH